MDGPAALRPLEEAAEPIRRLREYEAPAELASALTAVDAAAERALRLRLRNDLAAPEHERLTALSTEALPFDAVVQSLRTRDLISIELAGTVHELRAAAGRAREGGVRAADADVALRAVDRLRQELGTAERASSPAAAGAPDPAPAEAPRAAPEAGRAAPEAGRWMAWVGSIIAVLVLLGLAWALVRGGNRDFDRAVAVFRAGRLDSAEVAFQRVLEGRPDDVSALLYMARIHRRQGRPTQAGMVLRRAALVAPTDADVRRELGHLFMDLGEPRSAAGQYERAVEQEPDSPLNWAALIRALRTAGDPRAEQLLRDAPAEVQAALGGTG